MKIENPKVGFLSFPFARAGKRKGGNQSEKNELRPEERIVLAERANEYGGGVKRAVERDEGSTVCATGGCRGDTRGGNVPPGGVERFRERDGDGSGGKVEAVPVEGRGRIGERDTGVVGEDGVPSAVKGGIPEEVDGGRVEDLGPRG